MDIEFIVQDVFALTRPQWKLASNIEEAGRAFQLAMAQDQRTSGIDKAAEADDLESVSSSDEAGIAEGEGDGDGDDGSDSDSDMDVSRLGSASD